MIIQNILLCYAYDDKFMVNKLKKHLIPLALVERIAIWDDYVDICAGDDLDKERKKRLNEAQVVLLLVSASFFVDKYCSEVAMPEALRRYHCNDAMVLVVHLSPVLWEVLPIYELQSLPGRDKAISEWTKQEKVFKNVVGGIVKALEQWNVRRLPDPVAERGVLMTKLNQLAEAFAEAVREKMKPEARAVATANTLQQLSVFVPVDVALADLVVGWRVLSLPVKEVEEIPISRRRVTCGELAALASQFTTEEGNLLQAVKAWNAWATAFKNSDDPRQKAMAKTFIRELAELQAAAP